MTQLTRQSNLAKAATMTRVGQRSLRDHNLCLVFSHIASADPQYPLSRARLATATGLTKATVSSLVASLMDARLVIELRPLTHLHAGRPAIPIVVAGGTVAALGLEINVDFLGVRALDLTGAVLTESFTRMNLRQSDPAEAFGVLIERVYDVVRQLVDTRVRIIGACLALPGIADRPYGPLRLAPNLGWRDVDVPQVMAAAHDKLFHKLFHTGTFDKSIMTDLHTWLVDALPVDNEANLAARVEISQNPGESFIYVSGEIGIGAAIVVDGEVFTGLHGWAGEIGHIVVDSHGPTCACGASGCLEMYAGKRSLMIAAGLDPEDTLESLLREYESGNTMARKAVDRGAEALGMALADCMNIVDVDRVVMGGSFSALADVMRKGLSTQVSARVLSSRWLGEEWEVRASTTGDYPAATGAALAVLAQAVSDPASVLWQPA